MKKIHSKSAKVRRLIRVRNKTRGTIDRPRLTVHRSNIHIYAQIIDDVAEKTLACASDGGKKPTAKGTKSERAAAVGQLIAEKAKKLGITKVIFDRGAYPYHGRIKAVAESARKGGLDF